MAKDIFKAALAKFPVEQQKVLMKTIESAESLYPYAERVIAWGMPTLKIGEDYLCHVMGFKKHNSFFPSSGAVAATLKDELADYVVSKGTIQFSIDKPFPKSILKKVLAARLEQINDSYPKKSGLYIEYAKNGKVKKYIKNIKKGI
jgi:uncharacterized protein YdhG (YjbR/CyaY superfamily)